MLLCHFLQIRLSKGKCSRCRSDAKTSCWIMAPIKKGKQVKEAQADEAEQQPPAIGAVPVEEGILQVSSFVMIS